MKKLVRVPPKSKRRVSDRVDMISEDARYTPLTVDADAAIREALALVAEDSDEPAEGAG